MVGQGADPTVFMTKGTGTEATVVAKELFCSISKGDHIYNQQYLVKPHDDDLVVTCSTSTDHDHDP